MVNNIDWERVYVPEEKMAYRKLGGKVVLVDTAENRIITLNETASCIWGALDGRSLEKIVEVVLEEFENDRKEVTADVLEFLDNISRRGFIREKKDISS